MGHHHVAERAGRLIEGRTHVEAQRLGHIDLHVVDEVPVPDRLEQAVGEAERQDVLRRFLAQEVVDPEDLLLGEEFMQPGVQRHRAGEIGAKGLLHDDAAALDETGFGQQPHRRQGGGRRHAQIVQATALAGQGSLGRIDRRLQGAGAGRHRDVVQDRGESGPVRLVHLAAGESIERFPGDLAQAVGVELVQRDADDPAARDEAGPDEMEQSRQQLPSRQITRGAHENDNVRKSRTDP